MINHAKIKYQDEDRLSFLELDIETPDLPEFQIERYDNCISFYCLHWCQNMRYILFVLSIHNKNVDITIEILFCI